MKDYYKALDLERNASDEQIKQLRLKLIPNETPLINQN
jgi:curved DNA-binding protein CbpA